MGLLNPHLDDAAFAELWADRRALDAEESGSAAETHLRSCADCRARYTAFGSWLDALRQDACAEADEIFTAERLTAQQAQIARRLEALEHPARVIAFPRFAGPVAAGREHGRRWVAAAAAAGLVAGLGIGQLLELRRATGPSADTQPQIARATTSPAAVRVPIQPVSSPAGASGSDEAFLYGQDASAGLRASVPESLQYLNAITPSARDEDREQGGSAQRVR